MSKLLSRWRGLALLRTRAQGHVKGEANAWMRTPTGSKVARSILAPSRPT